MHPVWKSEKWSKPHIIPAVLSEHTGTHTENVFVLFLSSLQKAYFSPDCSWWKITVVSPDYCPPVGLRLLFTYRSLYSISCWFWKFLAFTWYITSWLNQKMLFYFWVNQELNLMKVKSSGKTWRWEPVIPTLKTWRQRIMSSRSSSTYTVSLRLSLIKCLQMCVSVKY